MGAFGLNASIMDAANLAWKLGLCAQGHANLLSLGPTYDQERRLHAARIIHISGSYLRFVCNSTLPVVEMEKLGADLGVKLRDGTPETALPPGRDADLDFLGKFFTNHGQFLLGVDAAYKASIISPSATITNKPVRPVAPLNGVRAPNPRLCHSTGSTGYLYDKMLGAATFHIVIFSSDLQGSVRSSIVKLSAEMSKPQSFFHRYGGGTRFNVLLVAKCLPFEAPSLLEGPELRFFRENATMLYDDRAPDEDAHTCYEVRHARGAVVVIRPDLWIGMSAFPDDIDALEDYFAGFLVTLHEHSIAGQSLSENVAGCKPLTNGTMASLASVASPLADGIR